LSYQHQVWLLCPGKLRTAMKGPIAVAASAVKLSRSSRMLAAMNPQRSRLPIRILYLAWRFGMNSTWLLRLGLEGELWFPELGLQGAQLKGLQIAIDLKIADAEADEKVKLQSKEEGEEQDEDPGIVLRFNLNGKTA